MPNVSEGSEGFRSASSGQGGRPVKQRTSFSQQASQEASQQAPQQASREPVQRTSRLHLQPDLHRPSQSGPRQEPQQARQQASLRTPQQALQQYERRTDTASRIQRGSKRHARATPGPPPPGPGAVIASSVRPSLGLKPHHGLGGTPSGPYTATGSSATSPSRPQTAAGPSVGSSSASQAATRPSVDPSLIPDTAAERLKGLSLRPDRAAERKIRILIRTEFYLAARNRQHYSSDLEEFRRILVSNYNQQIGVEHPRVQIDYHINDQKWRFNLENLHSDGVSNQDWWKMSMTSPIFDVVPHSPWKHHIRVMWEYLFNHYRISECHECYTPISVWLDPHLSLTEMKRIACSAVHFDTAIEALQPPNINHADAARSIWLHNSRLAQSRRTRSASVGYIDKCSTEEDLLYTIHGDDIEEYDWDLQTAALDGEIEFRKPQGCLRPLQIFSWAELTMTFILAAIRFGSPTGLSGRLQNIGALKKFVAQVDIPGAGPHHLDKMWEGRNLNAAREPMMFETEFANVDGEELEPREVWRACVTLKEMIELDARQCPASVPQRLQNYLNSFDSTA